MDHVISGGWTMNNQWRIDITALSGDSGGPVLAGSNAMGILSSGATNQTWYSTIDLMNNALGYRPCISATANPCT